MAFLYETHLHTRESSTCGVSRGREYVQRYLDLGYTGIIITDHFYRGNCRANRNLSWKKWVHEFCQGYENTREEGERQGLDVFFGWEETIGESDYLVYGLDKEWLLEHPETADWSRQKQFESVRRYGGCVVHAHPFRYAHYTRRGPISIGHVDAIEAGNAGNSQFSDAMALIYAEKQNMTATAGSDIHFVNDIRPATIFGVYMKKKMESIADYVDAVRNNKILKLKIPDGRFDLS